MSNQSVNVQALFNECENFIFHNLTTLSSSEKHSKIFSYKRKTNIFSLSSYTPDYPDISKTISNHEDILQDKLRHLILSKNLDEVEIYKKADIDRKLFSKIRTQPDYHPNKNTLIKLCLSMKLNTEETDDVLKAAGYSLSSSIKSDLIIKYCFKRRIYDIVTVNQILDHFGEKIV